MLHAALCYAGAERQKKRLLKTVPIVGVTCCSALLSALDGQRFDMVVLDECSQMVEPLSMVPLLRASCRRVLLSLVRGEGWVNGWRVLGPLPAQARWTGGY